MKERLLSQRYLHLRKENIKDMHNTDLIRACKEDKELLGEFLEENKEFLFSIIKHYKGNIEELCFKFRVTEEELLQHAYIGVISALQEFDFHRGIKFTTFVVRPIIWEINQLLYNDSRFVRLSRGAVEQIKRMIAIEEKLGYRPGEEEMAKLLAIPLERYKEIARFSDEIEHYHAYENFEVIDHNCHNIEEHVVDKVYIEHLLGSSICNDFEKTIMKLIMEGINNTQIAERLQVYPMTINRAIMRIRNKVLNFQSNKSGLQNNVTSKYDREIKLIEEESRSRNKLMCVSEISELLEGYGFDKQAYSNRILYYIRQKVSKKWQDQPDEVGKLSKKTDSVRSKKPVQLKQNAR
nr:sigma factor [Brevibacillus laterosporus]